MSNLNLARTHSKHMPDTFVLPSEHHQFSQQEPFESRRLWVLKELGVNQGAGVTTHLSAEAYATRLRSPEGDFLVQEMIAPHLWNGFKFDLRLYAVLRLDQNSAPPSVFLFHQGLVHIAPQLFTPDAKPSTSRAMHVLNSDEVISLPPHHWHA